MPVRPTPALKRFEIQVLKDKSGTDPAQVPSASTINFYRQGATSNAAVNVPYTGEDPDPQPTTLTVYNTGSLEPNDTVQIDADASPTKLLQVVTVDRVTNVLTVLNQTYSTGAVSVAVGTRLVPTNSRPSIYSDPAGSVAIGTSITTTATTGRASGYLTAYRYDYVVSITTLSPRLYVDAEGSYAMR